MELEFELGGRDLAFEGVTKDGDALDKSVRSATQQLHLHKRVVNREVKARETVQVHEGDLTPDAQTLGAPI